MITAKEALQLDEANFPSQYVVQLQAVLKIIDDHIRKRMTFMGPFPLELAFREMSRETCQAMCFILKRYGWNVNANLLAAESKIRGGQPEPHHWMLQFQPTPESYADLDIVSSFETQSLLQ